MATPLKSMDPTFHKYEKMEESTRGFEGHKINHIKQWIAMEKIHGANLSLTVWNKESGEIGVKIGRRNDYLKPGENFFGLENQLIMLQQLRQNSETLWKNLTPQPKSLIIYGELFGGYYPHSSVDPIPGVVHIQKEVAYCPEIKFCAYDILLSQITGEQEYMDYDIATGLLSEAGFMYSRPLFSGTLEEATDYPLGFITTLPAQFGLPTIDNNLAEGVVIKPVKNVVIETRRGPTRIIFKRKIPKFSERLAIPRPIEHEDVKKRYKDPDNFEMLKYEMYALITEQRLVNAISKLGRPEKKEDYIELKRELVGDVLETLQDDNKEMWAKCEEDCNAMAMLKKEVWSQCSQLIKSYKP